MRQQLVVATSNIMVADSVGQALWELTAATTMSTALVIVAVIASPGQ